MKLEIKMKASEHKNQAMVNPYYNLVFPTSKFH